MRLAKRLMTFVTVVVTLFLVTACPGATDGPEPERLYVDRTADGDETGSSWENAYTTLTEALVDARNESVREVWIAAGTYYPDERLAANSSGQILDTFADNRAATFYITEGITIYGGFAGGEARCDERDPELNATVLSGDIDQSGSHDANSNHVVYLDGKVEGGITAATVIDGVTITMGQADDSGGGLVCDGNAERPELESEEVSCSAVLRNLRFNDNRAQTSGGALYLDGRFAGSSSPTLSNVIFSGNEAGEGGAMASDARFGGSNNSVLSEVVFRNNRSEENGGAVVFTGETRPILTNVVFENNEAGLNGGALSHGGGDSTSRVVLTNVIFRGNRAAENGGAILSALGRIGSASALLTNATLSGNEAGGDGGAIYNSNPGTGEIASSITNSIVWGNRAANEGAQIYNDGVDAEVPSLNYSIVEGGDNGIVNGDSFSAGTGNLDADPQFMASDDLRLSAGSPAIDAGSNDELPADPTDLDNDGNTDETLPVDLNGNPRVVGDSVDMGAYERP